MGAFKCRRVKDLRVSNIYYSGCTLEQHWNWYVEKFSEYTFITIKDGTRVSEKNMDLEYCLSAEEDWDVISFLQSNRYGYRKDGGVSCRESIQKYLPLLYPVVHDRFPNAKYCWLQSWAHEIRQSSNPEMKKGVENLEAQLEASAIFRDVAKEVCQEFGFTQVPCGDAWELIRHDPMFYEKGEGDYPVRSLHTRIFNASMNNFPNVYNQDLSHDGDIGGGQYLNACVWFEVLMKKSVVGNSFRPVYVHEPSGTIYQFTEKKILVLQNAAHQAVLNFYGEDYYQQ